MKKTPSKLVVRSETLRMLANMDLRRVVGGYDSGVATCPRQDILDTGRINCTSQVVLDTGLIACATGR